MSDFSQILRWLVTAIVVVVAIMLSVAVLHVATILLKYSIRALILLLVVAAVVRVVEYLRTR